MRASFYTICFLFTLFASDANSQVSGCKDPAATNYNSSATINDGSCVYNITAYTPPVKVDPISTTLTETSGLQMAGDFLWSFNDGGNAAAIYRLDTVTGNILQTVNLGGATNVDWEDIAFDGTHFYIGDFGNNTNGARTDLKIYKFPLNAIPDYNTDAVTTIPPSQIEIINFSYADQVPVTATTANNTKWDCEAMIVDGGRIHLFSKNWVDLTSTHFVINGVVPGSYLAAPVETLNTGYLVTGADKAAGVNLIALIGYQNSGTANHFMHLLADFSDGFFFNGNKRRINLPDVLTMGQAEGICFRNSTYGYISNEFFTRTVGPFTFTVHQKLRAFTTSSFAPMYTLPANLLGFNVTKAKNTHRIEWSFSEPVNELKVLRSENRIDFTEAKTYPVSKDGKLLLQPSSKNSCYKLAWQRAGGGDKFSPTICVKSNFENSFQNLVLRSTGYMSFISGKQNAGILFRLLSTDGKTLAETSRNISQGPNNIRFEKVFTPGNIIILQTISDKQQNSILLRVE